MQRSFREAKMEKIDEIWIINPYGITVFNYARGKMADSSLMGGFFSGFQKVLKEFKKDELKSIHLQNSKFLIYQNREFLFIYHAGNATRDTRILRNLKKVKTRFFQNFGEKLRNWDGNTTYFDNFSETVEEIFNGSEN